MAMRVLLSSTTFWTKLEAVSPLCNGRVVKDLAIDCTDWT